MALSNRDRINKAMELLGPAVNRFLSTLLDDQLPDGTTWVDLLKLKDQGKGAPSSKAYSADDPSDSLRVFTDNLTSNYRRGWYPLSARLSRVEQSYATELRNYRHDLSLIHI